MPASQPMTEAIGYTWDQSAVPRDVARFSVERAVWRFRRSADLSDVFEQAIAYFLFAATAEAVSQSHRNVRRAGANLCRYRLHGGQWMHSQI